MHDIEKSPNCLENEVVAVEHILMSFKKIFVSKINQQFKCDAKPTQMGGFDFSFFQKNREFETNDFLINSVFSPNNNDYDLEENDHIDSEDALVIYTSGE